MTTLDQFAQKLHASPNLTEETWRREWSEKVAEEWRSRVAVDTGAYRDSITVTAEGASSDVEYSVFNEYGTAHMAPRPALVPAINYLSRPSAEDLGRRVIRDLT